MRHVSVMSPSLIYHESGILLPLMQHLWSPVWQRVRPRCQRSENSVAVPSSILLSADRSIMYAQGKGCTFVCLILLSADRSKLLALLLRYLLSFHVHDHDKLPVGWLRVRSLLDIGGHCAPSGLPSLPSQVGSMVMVVTDKWRINGGFMADKWWNNGGWWKLYFA